MAAKSLPSQEFLRECFLYDGETGVILWRQRPPHHFKNDLVQRQWNTKHFGKKAAYPNTDYRYLRVGLFGSHWAVHRIIWRMKTGEDAPQIDHKDCNGMNNKWRNLRLATHDLNVLNQRGWNGRVLPKGVTHHGSNYRATIQFRKKLYSLGTYKTIDEAVNAYRDGARRLHGEFANFGVPLRGDGQRGHR